MPHGTAQITTSSVTPPTAPGKRMRRSVRTVAAAMPASRHRAYVCMVIGPSSIWDHTGSGLGIPRCMGQPYRADRPIGPVVSVEAETGAELERDDGCDSDPDREDQMRRMTRRVARVVLGWTLVALGVAALVLPGPGLLLLA